ncbi:translocation protein sec66 [Mycena amicta]|nr:translocation protein sec66 [Mycena amicta]
MPSSTSVLVPVLYMVIILGGLGLFSIIYRRKTAAKSLPPYFPTHAERNIYVTLLQKTDPPVSDALLKSALVRRAMTDVQRVLRLREDKPALQNLVQKGSIGEDLWNSLLAAEKELEAEIMEVVAEANSFVEGWGQLIFPTANEMIANEKMRAMFEASESIKQTLQLKYNIQKPSLPALAPPTVNGNTDSDAESGARSPSKVRPAPIIACS